MPKVAAFRAGRPSTRDKTGVWIEFAAIFFLLASILMLNIRSQIFESQDTTINSPQYLLNISISDCSENLALHQN